MFTDDFWMQEALKEANLAEELGEVPVGAIIVYEGRCIARGHNSPIRNNDPSAHAEIVAIREAGKFLDNYRLVNTTLYVTLEPCLMCVGAMVHARIKRCVFGALDKRSGALISNFDVFTSSVLNHRLEIVSGIKSEVCSIKIKNFFIRKR